VTRPAIVQAGDGQHDRLARVTRKTESLHGVILILYSERSMVNLFI
jgi:hypothetical protein